MNKINILNDLLEKLYQQRYLIRVLATRDFKVQYVGSFFGFLWAVLNPLAQLIIYGVVFGVFFRSKPDPVYHTDNFFLYLLCGLVPWQFFSQTVASTTSVIVSNKNLIKKTVGFNSEILPVIIVLSNIVSHLIGVGIMLLIVVVINQKLSLFTPLILLYLFIIIIFSLGIGWILSSINVYFRDMQQVVGLIMMGWMFLTPIFYTPALIPTMILPIFKLNPIFHMVEGYRFAILADKTLPLRDILYLLFTSVLTFVVGGLLFRKLKSRFAEVL